MSVGDHRARCGPHAGANLHRRPLQPGGVLEAREGITGLRHDGKAQSTRSGLTGEPGAGQGDTGDGVHQRELHRHPIADHEDAGGRRVEGTGVQPDVVTPLTRRDLAAGRLGIEGDFDRPYTTMNFHAEARIAEEAGLIAQPLVPS